MHGIDVSETEMLRTYGDTVVSNMLKDHTTKEPIFWATDSYEHLGDGYRFADPITVDLITGDNDMVIRPRVAKSRDEQLRRVKEKAEVFTPSWVCNAQNNLIDEAWFGRTGVFNTENDNHTWTITTDPISFPDDPEKSWRHYVADRRLEITCGEAPYLASRYDTVTGDYIPVPQRIGLLDRKLRIVSENTATEEDWLLWALVALCATYGFDYQGDNVLLAREALFYSFLEHFEYRFGHELAPKEKAIDRASYVISWNVWQMDGLTFGLPGYTPTEAKQGELFENIKLSVRDKFCVIKDFIGAVNFQRENLKPRDFIKIKRPICRYVDLTRKS